MSRSISTGCFILYFTALVKEKYFPKIWCLLGCNDIQIHNVASRKRTLSHLARNSQFDWVVEFLFANWEGVGSNLNSVTSTSVMELIPSNEVTKFQAT